MVTVGIAEAVTVTAGLGLAVTVCLTCATAAGLDDAAVPHAARPPISASAPIPAQIVLMLTLIYPSDPAGPLRPGSYPVIEGQRAYDRAISDNTRPLCSTFTLGEAING